MTFYIILALSTFLISIVGTKLVILTLKNRPTAPDIELITGKKKSLIPQNGGIAFIFAIIIGFLGIEGKTLHSIMPSIFLLTGLPLLNGIISINNTVKSIILIGAIAFPLSIIQTPIFFHYTHPLLDKSIAGFLWLLIIHIFMKLDKTEGLLPIATISIGSGIVAIFILSNIFFSPFSIQALIFATSGLGFLWWNYNPAKTFAGEVASIPIGFIAGYLLIHTAEKGFPLIALIIPAYFTIASFLYPTEKKPLTKWIMRLIIGINMLLIFISTQSLIHPEMAIFNLIIAYAMVFATIWIFNHIKISNSHENI